MIAPDSAHALHMPSHIFARLGLWQETIDANVRSAASGAHAVMDHHGSAGYQLHAMDYLEYAYVQRGEEAKAREVIAQLNGVPGAPVGVVADNAAYGTAKVVLDLHRWEEAESLPLTVDLVDTYRARAIGAARIGDRAAADENLAKLQEINRRYQEQQQRAGNPQAEVSIDQLEAEAWVAFVDGRVDEALADLRRAAERESNDAGESVTVPAREMMADLLFELKRPLEALAAYKAVLTSSPNRFDAIYGAAQAARQSGDGAASNGYFRQLVQIAAPDADRPEIAEAKAVLVAE